MLGAEQGQGELEDVKLCSPPDSIDQSPVQKDNCYKASIKKSNNYYIEY